MSPLKRGRRWCSGGNVAIPDSFRPAKRSGLRLPRKVRCAACGRRLTPRTHIHGGGYEVTSSVPPHREKGR